MDTPEEKSVFRDIVPHNKESLLVNRKYNSARSMYHSLTVELKTGDSLLFEG